MTTDDKPKHTKEAHFVSYLMIYSEVSPEVQRNLRESDCSKNRTKDPGNFL